MENSRTQIQTQAQMKAKQKFECVVSMENSISQENIVFDYIEDTQKKATYPSIIKGIPPLPVQNIAVIGGGTMGCAIIAAFLSKGYDVTFVAKNAESLERNAEKVSKILSSVKKHGKISEVCFQDACSRFQKTLDYKALSKADFILETVYEDFKLKQSIFQIMDQYAKKDAILATNTSYLDIEKLSENLSNARSVVGFHFFNPAHIMKLIEVIRTSNTSPEVLATCFDLAGKLSKKPVLSGVCEGFIGNRLLKVYRETADHLLEKGCMPHEIDEAMRDFGYKLGPYEAQDLGGLDIAWANRKRTLQAQKPQNYSYIADRVCEAGRLGLKAGKGWYDYDEQKNKKPSKEVEEIILQESQKKNLIRKTYSKEEIQKQILFSMVNEACALIHERIVERASDIDVVLLNGYGFPKNKGGICYYADLIGLPKIAEALEHWQESGEINKLPSLALKTLARENRLLSQTKQI